MPQAAKPTAFSASVNGTPSFAPPMVQIATEAARACRSFAREVAGLHRLVALIDPRNVASQRVAAKIGLAFEREASVPGKVLRVYSSDL